MPTSMPTPPAPPLPPPPLPRRDAQAAPRSPDAPPVVDAHASCAPALDDVPLVDAERVALLRAHGVWPEIVESFGEYAPVAVAGIEGALQAGAREALYAEAHKLKGCCANLGLLRLAAHAAALEAAAERPAGRLGPGLAGDLRQIAAASVAALEAG